MNIRHYFNMILIHIIVLLHLTDFAHNFYIPSLKNVDSNNYPKDVQHAFCNIITKEIETSAVAKTTRHLKGVCSTVQLEKKFRELETKIADEFKSIRDTLETNGFKVVLPPKRSNNVTEENVLNNNLIYDEDYDISDENNVGYRNLMTKHANVDEIQLYNDTLVETENGETYYYYWRIEGIKSVIVKRDIYISSHEFTILGHDLHLQFYPNYQPDFIGITLRSQSHGFVKKHKFTIFNAAFTNQIKSKTILGLTNEEKIFKIHRSMLHDSFLLDDNLIIKLELYLQS